MQRIYIDFETTSACDLKEKGSDNYFKDPSTHVLCMAYAIDEGPVSLWLPGQSKPHFKNAEMWAHNSSFEFGIWNNVFLPDFPLKLEQMHCTMSMAAAMGLPQSLEQAALACNIKEKKDSLAHRVMMMLCKPKKDGTFYTPEEVPEKFKILYDYCKQDVEVERALAKRLAPLNVRERDIWLLDQTINQRGVGIDTKSAARMQQLVDKETDRLNRELNHLTNWQVSSVTSTAQFKKWMKSKGVESESLDKSHTKELLHDQTIPQIVVDALCIREEAAKSSTAKYKAMLNTQNGGRARGLFQYFGAATGRWAGRKIQLQNLPRPKLKQHQIDKAIDDPLSISQFDESIMHIASDAIRSMFVPAPGNTFVCADFSNIEGRGLAWLAGETWKIRAFAEFDLGCGDDIYRLSYSKAFHKPLERVSEDDRQIGKVMELALGYGGGVGAFQTMAKGYGVTVSDTKAEELKIAWRDAHPKTKSFWYTLEEAATSAITHPGQTFKAGKILYVKKGSFLCCKLPSGRVMYYAYPKHEMVDTPWGDKKMGITYMAVDSQRKQWSKQKTYGGSLAENITQAVARDILAEAMLRVEAAGYKIVIHVHDEIVAEVEKGQTFTLRDFEDLMAEVPEWAKGFPIAAKGWTGDRYKKG